MLLRTLVGLVLSIHVYAQANDTATSAPPEQADYGGPSVLSRGLLPSVTSRTAPVKFRPHISANGICDNALTDVRLDASGHFSNATACGVEAVVGIYGYHNWKRTAL